MSSTEWETPQDFFDELNKEFQFEMDVCASKENAKCPYFWTKEEDAFTRNWHYFHSLFMNPPYSKDIDKWIGKAYEASQKGTTVVCLIQGRSTDTKWWHSYIMRSSEIRYIKDRLHFGINKKFSRANISSIIVVFHPYSKGPPLVCSIDTKGRVIN